MLIIWNLNYTRICEGTNVINKLEIINNLYLIEFNLEGIEKV